MELRDRVIEILKMWSFNGTTESDSAEAIADEIIRLCADEFCEEYRD